MLFKVWRKDGIAYLVKAASGPEAIYKFSQDEEACRDPECDVNGFNLTAKVVIFKDSGVQDTKEERLRV